MLKIFTTIREKISESLFAARDNSDNYALGQVLQLAPISVHAQSKQNVSFRSSSSALQYGEKGRLANIMLLVALFLLTYLSFVGINSALAADGGMTDATSALIKPFCYIIKLITGTVGKTIIVLILISLVIMLFLGKVSWGLALTFLFGVGLLFSAPTLVDMLGGGISSGSEGLSTTCQNAISGS